MIPRELEEGVLYISREYQTAVHSCFCGCGQKVVTPISPAKWTLREVSGRVTLNPSIGNWAFPCRSHYWIKNNRVEWADDMSDEQVRRVREHDSRLLEKYVESQETTDSTDRPIPEAGTLALLLKMWKWIKSLFTGK
jgi:hypothetical protein